MIRRFRAGSASVLSCVLVLLRSAAADRWQPPTQKEYFSPNHNYVFRVTPDRYWAVRMGRCLGELYKVEEADRSIVWRRYLANNHAPVQTFVADSGQYVVTLDEWGRVGELPVVIYGFQGKVVKVHSLESLFKGKEIPGRVSVSSRWWDEDSLVFFGPKDTTFFIYLCTSQVLMLQLQDGDVMDEHWYAAAKRRFHITEQEWESLRTYGKKRKKRAAELALECLKSKHPRERKTGALFAGQFRLREAIPTLRSLLSDEAYWLSSLHGGTWMYRDYYVRRAAKEALELLGEKTGDIVVERQCARRVPLLACPAV